MRIGSGFLGGRFFNGLIDEVSIYDRALSEVEIQSIVSAGSGGKCRSVLEIVNLVDVIIQMDLQQGISVTLDAKLEASLDAINDMNEENDVAAINSLNALINQAEAQRGTKLTDEQADLIIGEANQIIDNIMGL